MNDAEKSQECWDNAMHAGPESPVSAQWAVAAAGFAQAAAISAAARHLGTGNAATDMGAIEALSVSVKEGMQAIADAVREGRD
jgi:hypothetical protein